MQIRIDKPCTEQWNDMEETKGGKYCHKCCKTIIDFTDWEADAIKDYLRTTSKEVCGRLKTEQLETSRQSTQTNWFRLSIAAILLLCNGFITSCKEKKKGTEKAVANPPECDSVLTPNNSYILGGISPMTTDSLPTEEGQ